MPSVKRYLWGAVIFVVSVAVLTGCYLLFFTAPEAGPEWQSQVITVTKGQSTARIARSLHQNGVITHPLPFRLLAQMLGLNKKLKAGRYKFEGPLSAWQAVRQLDRGANVYNQVTIPEGLTMYQISGLLQSATGADSSELLGAFSDKALAGYRGIPASNLEGYLFPNTYDFEWGTPPSNIAERLVEHFFQQFRPESLQEIKKQKRTLHQTVIMASLIEAEAQVDSERVLVASVFYNRLKARRPLESCASIEYVLPRRKKTRLTYADLEIKSPYNTYKRIGLPPGPICNPGLRSLEAAVYPKKTDYLYFVAKGDGGHVFSRSLREHINAKNRINKKKEE
jgi:UPF0755 protein